MGAARSSGAVVEGKSSASTPNATERKENLTRSLRFCLPIVLPVSQFLEFCLQNIEV